MFVFCVDLFSDEYGTSQFMRPATTVLLGDILLGQRRKKKGSRMLFRRSTINTGRIIYLNIVAKGKFQWTGNCDILLAG